MKCDRISKGGSVIAMLLKLLKVIKGVVPSFHEACLSYYELLVLLVHPKIEIPEALIEQLMNSGGKSHI